MEHFSSHMLSFNWRTCHFYQFFFYLFAIKNTNVLRNTELLWLRKQLWNCLLFALKIETVVVFQCNSGPFTFTAITSQWTSWRIPSCLTFQWSFSEAFNIEYLPQLVLSVAIRSLLVTIYEVMTEYFNSFYYLDNTMNAECLHSIH